MADRVLTNIGTMDGTYADMPFENSASSELEVTLTEVSFEKEADQSIWFSGDLTITFTVDNTDGEGPLDLIVIRDLLDNTKFDYIPTSLVVQLTDTTPEPDDTATLILDTDYSVNFVSPSVDDPTKDLLEITFLAGGDAASIPIGSIVTITFKGSKVPA